MQFSERLKFPGLPAKACRVLRDMTKDPLPACLMAAGLLKYGDRYMHRHFARRGERDLEALMRGARIVVLGIGLNMIRTSGLQALSHTVDAMRRVDRLAQRKQPPQHVVWMLRPKEGALKPYKYLGTQAGETLRHFNAQTAAEAERLGFSIFDPYNLTAGAHSQDGTHYGQTVSVTEAQFLLYYLSEHVAPETGQRRGCNTDVWM